MAEQFWEWMVSRGLWVTCATVIFFTVKGMLWLVLPALVVRRVRRGYRGPTAE